MKQIQIDKLHFELFIDYEQIQKQIRLMGIDISVQYADKNPVFIGVLNGCFMFMADLMKEVTIPCQLSFVKLASYEGVASQGTIQQLLGVGMDLKDRHVVIVEDVIDTGNSLKHTIATLQDLDVASISVCALLIKPDCLVHQFDEDLLIGFEIDKEFVVGYGLDYNGQGRNLPDIYKNVSL